MRYSLVFPGAPVAKGRPRFARNGHCYTPDKTRNAETAMRLEAKKQWKKPPLEGPLHVTIWFCMFRPKNSKNLFWHYRRPDLDNLIKCLDALNGIVWTDDAQLSSITAQKLYDAEPRIELVVETL